MTREQEDLLRKARESVGAAKAMMREGFFDFAAGRAYYAMFYVAEAVLLGEGLSFSSHAAVISEFGRLFAKTGRAPAQLHRDLLSAHAARLIGDYSASRGVPEAEAADHVAAAETFLEAGRALIV